MARALLLVALAAGAAALPQRLRASASPAKTAAHDHPRRAAPSLAALDASLGDLTGTLEKEAHGAAHAGGVSRALGALEADVDELNSLAFEKADAASSAAAYVAEKVGEAGGNQVWEWAVNFMNKGAQEVKDDDDKEPLLDGPDAGSTPATRQLRDAMLEAMSKIDALVAALKAKKLTSAAASVLA